MRAQPIPATQGLILIRVLRPTRAMLSYVLLTALPNPPAFVLAVVIAAAISMAVFRHADKHGNTHATAWGVGAFLAAGVVVPVYFLRYWLSRKPS